MPCVITDFPPTLYTNTTAFVYDKSVKKMADEPLKKHFLYNGEHLVFLVNDQLSLALT